MQTRCPDHYRFGPLQARDIIEQVIGPIRDSVRAYHTATALKYLLRHTRKAGIDDLLKCRDHLNWAIARAQGVSNERVSDSTTWRDGDIDAVCGVADRERASVQSETHPMHHIALEMAEKAVAARSHKAFETFADPPSVDAACAYLERVSKPQTVADEPWEAAP